jgi:carotenoid cleavage dioxygenase
VWDAWVSVPYVGMLHDYQVTENFVMLYVIPLAIDEAQIARGGIHWSWYSGQPTYFGYFRRGGDGKDIKWIKGPERSATHMMGGFDDGKRLYADVEMSLSNPFPSCRCAMARGDPCAAPATSRGCRPMCR